VAVAGFRKQGLQEFDCLRPHQRALKKPMRLNGFEERSQCGVLVASEGQYAVFSGFKVEFPVGSNDFMVGENPLGPAAQGVS
jgi:hypothetical protein